MIKPVQVISVGTGCKKRLMLKCFFIFILIIFNSSLWAQDSTITVAEKAMLDSMFKNDEFLKMLGEKQDSSYIDFGVGLSNGIFSLKNNSLNAGQATTNKIFYSASAGYFHKSGFAISANAFATPDGGQMKLFQYAVTPSYSSEGKNIDWALSYTRYIKGVSTGFDINPYKNELYGNTVFKKKWLRPAIGAGYSTGRVTEYFDSVITFVLVPRTVTIRDTIITKLSSFSLNFSLSHIWEFENVFSKHDAIQFQPAVIINGSNQKFTIEHTGTFNSRRPRVQQLLKIAYGDGKHKDRFSLQSIAFMGSIAYGRGRFILHPQIYLDYYLQETLSKKLSALYSFVISYAF